MNKAISYVTETWQNIKSRIQLLLHMPRYSGDTLIFGLIIKIKHIIHYVFYKIYFSYFHFSKMNKYDILIKIFNNDFRIEHVIQSVQNLDMFASKYK